MERVVIELKGGVVTGVHCDNAEEVEVVILDWDEEDAGGCPAWAAELEPLSAMTDDAQDRIREFVDEEEVEDGEEEEVA